MVMAKKEDHLRMRMEHIRFGKEELERRRKSPVLAKGEEIEAQLKEHYHVYIVDPRLGFNQRTFRFWINYRSVGEEMEYSGWQLGHRHTVEAVIYILQGKGHSVIDGIKYPWEAGDLICVPVFAWQVSLGSRRSDLRSGLCLAQTSQREPGGPDLPGGDHRPVFHGDGDRHLRRGEVSRVLGLRAEGRAGDEDPDPGRSGGPSGGPGRFGSEPLEA